MNEFKESLKVSEEETKKLQQLYEKHKQERNKRVYKKFGATLKAHIDSEWQEEIINDLEDEFNERNRGGYGR